MLAKCECDRLAADDLPQIFPGSSPRSWPKRLPWWTGSQLARSLIAFATGRSTMQSRPMREIGLSECELWQGHVEPKLKPDELTKWRFTEPLQTFKTIGNKFRDAGIDLYAYNYSLKDKASDEEFERGFEMVKAMGVSRITASSTVTAAARYDKFAPKYQVFVGMHNHSVMKENEFNTPESFAKALDGRSKYIMINLDIGHFTARRIRSS